MRPQEHWSHPSGGGRVALLAVSAFLLFLASFVASAANLPASP